MIKHIPVMKKEAIKALNLQEDGVYVDATLGGGGHASSILEKVKRGYLFAFEKDSEIGRKTSDKLSKIAHNFTVIDCNFRYIKEELEKREVKKVNGILFDLGTSSFQLDNPERGFNYHEEGPLDLRMDRRSSLTGEKVVNTYSEEELTKIFKNYGEVKFSKEIAHEIVKRREEKKIKTTLELSELIKRVVPLKFRLSKHPSRLIFQALRIEVNDELNALKEGLQSAIELVDVGGRIVVISFQSLEDKIVKAKFKEVTDISPLVKGMPNVDLKYLPDFKAIKVEKKPSKEEIDENKRARSAIMRVIERVK